MQVDELRNAYRSTWLEWARQTDALQQIVDGNGDAAQMEKLIVAVERARAAHSEARDRLARMLGNAPEPRLRTRTPSDDRIRIAAHLLWEAAGRPAGTAESDWARAREMVRMASSCPCCV